MIKTLTQLSQENGAYLDTTYPLASKIVFYDEADLLDVFGKYCVQCENGMSFFYKGKALIYNVSIFVKLQPIRTPIPISVTAKKLKESR